MTTHYDQDLACLIEAHSGQDALKTPLLNRARILLDSLAELAQAQQDLADGAPVVDLASPTAVVDLRAASALYWQDLAPGTQLSRLAQAKALRGEDLLQRVQLLVIFGKTTAAGHQLLLDLIEPQASRPAPRVYAVALHASDGQRVILPGATLLASPLNDRYLLVWAGLGEQLFEFDSSTDAGRGLVEFMLGEQGKPIWDWLRAQDATHWQPEGSAEVGLQVKFDLLGEDFLDYAFKASIASDLSLQLNARAARTLSADLQAWTRQRAQWFCRRLPPPIEAAIAQALDADRQRQSALLTFASMGPAIASGLVEDKISRCLDGIQAYCGDDLNSYEHQCYRQVHAAWQAAQGKIRQIVNQAGEQRPALTADFWGQATAQGLSRRQQLAASLVRALAKDAQLQRYEGSLSAAGLALASEVLGKRTAAQRGPQGAVVARLAVGEASFAWPLPGAYVFGAIQAWQMPDQLSTVLLLFTGEDGGLQEFASLRALSDTVAASLKDPAFSPVWVRYTLAAQRFLKPLLRLPALPLVSTPVSEDWIDDHLDRVLAEHVERLERSEEDSTRHLSFDELAAALAAPLHEVRETAVNRIAERRRLQALLENMPRWLTGAPEAARRQYASLLEDYNRLAGGQERALQDQPTLIQPFASQLLARRLLADLRHSVDPERVQLRMPDAVEIKAVTNVPSEIRVPSKVLEDWSLTELALWNIDRQVTLRLGYAHFIDRDTGLALSIPGLTTEYLRRLIIELDVARQYRQQLATVFKVETAQTLRTQILLLPYAAAFRLQVFAAYHKGRVSQAGRGLLERVAGARTAQDLPAGSRLSSVQLSLGGSERHTSALLLIEAGEAVFLYLPGVPDGASIIQGASVSAVKETLLGRLRTASTRTWLAGLGGLGEPSPGREAYLNEACQRDFSGFVRFVKVHYPVWPLACALLNHRLERLLNEARAVSRSREDVRSAFARQLREGATQLLHSGLYYLPGIGTALEVYDGWQDASAAAAAFERGDAALGLRRLASAEMNFGFALLLFVPGLGAARVARQAVRPHRLRRGPALSVGTSVTRLNGFAGHEVKVNLLEARPQYGIDAGTWKQAGKLYIWQDAKAYEVYRRSGELSLRLRRTATNSHEHPVRVGPDGRFVTHLDSGLRAGGRSRAGSASADESVMSGYLIDVNDRALMETTLKQQSKYTLDEYGISLRPTPGDQALADFKRLRRKLLTDADAFLKDVEIPPRVELPSLASDASHAQLIEAVYGQGLGLVIGEAHASRASKRFLIDNFATLKAQGVKTLYFEHLLVDFVGDDLKALNQSGVLGANLSKRLEALDKGHGVDPGQPYTFYQVIVEANRQGLEVVSLDCAASWYSRGMQDVGTSARQRMFSYLASKTIQAHQASAGEHKWVALVGNSHSNKHRSTLGLAELNKAIGVRVVDLKPGGRAQLQRDPGMETSFNQGLVKADFLLEVDMPPRGAHGPLTSPVEVAERELAWSQASTSAARQPGPSKLQHPGSFYLEKSSTGRVLVHLSRDGTIYRTEVKKQMGFYSVSRPSWDKVHERRFWAWSDFLSAMSEQGMTYVGKYPA
jgi:hypothetical protein